MLVACKENKETMMLVDISRYKAGFEEENDTIILDKNRKTLEEDSAYL